MATTPQQSPCDAVRFEPNVPQRCALKFAGPKMITGKWGERAMYSLTDGRVLFVDAKVAETIAMMDIRPGEAFYVCKRWNGDRQQAARWDVWLDPATEKARAKAEESEIESQLMDSLAAAQLKNANGANGSHPSAPVNAPTATSEQQPKHVANGNHTSELAHSGWAAQIRERAQANIEIYWQIVHWAQEQCPGITKNEIRAFVMNAMISSERMGGRR